MASKFQLYRFIYFTTSLGDNSIYRLTSTIVAHLYYLAVMGWSHTAGVIPNSSKASLTFIHVNMVTSDIDKMR